MSIVIIGITLMELVKIRHNLWLEEARGPLFKTWRMIESWEIGLQLTSHLIIYHLLILSVFKLVWLTVWCSNSSAARAELIALIQACQHAVNTPSCQSAEFIVDAQYVINVIHLVQREHIFWHKVKNWNLWKQKYFTITKNKSHQELHMAKKNQDKWNIVGNYHADLAAGQAL